MEYLYLAVHSELYRAASGGLHHYLVHSAVVREVYGAINA